MGKGSGTTRASRSNNPKGLSANSSGQKSEEQIVNNLSTSYTSQNYNFVKGDGLAYEFRQAYLGAKYGSFYENGKTSYILNEADKYMSLPTNAKKSVVNDIAKSIRAQNDHLGNIESIKYGVAKIDSWWKAYGDGSQRTKEYSYRPNPKAGDNAKNALNNMFYFDKVRVPSKHSNPQQELANRIISAAFKKGIRITKVVANENFD